MLRRTFLASLVGMSTYLLGKKTQAKVYTFGKMQGRGELLGKLDGDWLHPKTYITANGAIYVPWLEVWSNRYGITRRLLGVSRGNPALDEFFKRICKQMSFGWVNDVLKEHPDRIYVRFYKNKYNGLSCHYLLDHPSVSRKRGYEKNLRVVFDRSNTPTEVGRRSLVAL